MAVNVREVGAVAELRNLASWYRHQHEMIRMSLTLAAIERRSFIKPRPRPRWARHALQMNSLWAAAPFRCEFV